MCSVGFILLTALLMVEQFGCWCADNYYALLVLRCCYVYNSMGLHKQELLHFIIKLFDAVEDTNFALLISYMNFLEKNIA